MKYLAGWQWGLFGDEQLLQSGRIVLSGHALRTADDSTGERPLFGLFMCSQFQTTAPENATCGKNMIGWKIDFLFYNWEFSGDFG